MNLKDYLEKAGVTIKDFAGMLMYTRSYMSRIVNGKSVPSERLKKQIEYVTSGRVKF
jgi:transcriptional regulator with XRE-family HTH domain